MDACFQYSSSVQLIHYQELPLWILKWLWKNRNKLIFQQKWMHWKAVLKYAKSDVNEWKMVEVQEESVPILMPAFHTSQRNNHTWRRPPLGWLKWNLDGSVYNTDTDASAGWILHDADGFYLYSVQAIERKVSTAMEVE